MSQNSHYELEISIAYRNGEGVTTNDIKANCIRHQLSNSSYVCLGQCLWFVINSILFGLFTPFCFLPPYINCIISLSSIFELVCEGLSDCDQICCA